MTNFVSENVKPIILRIPNLTLFRNNEILYNNKGSLEKFFSSPFVMNHPFSKNMKIRREEKSFSRMTGDLRQYYERRASRGTIKIN